MPRKSRALAAQSMPVLQVLAGAIRLVVLMYVRFPLSLRNVENLLSSAALVFAPRRCGFGGTVSARCSRLTAVSV